MIKVLMLFSAAGLGGAERSLTRMCLASREPDVSYQLGTVGGEGDWAQWVRTQRPRPVVFSCGGLRMSSLRDLWGLLRFLRTERPHVIYAVGLRACGIVRLMKPLLGGVRIVHAIRTSFPADSDLTMRYTRSEKLLKRLTSGYIANSTAGADTLARITDLRRADIRVISNGIDVPEPMDESARAPSKQIAVVANLHPLKGHLPFLEVVAAVASKHPGVLFLFIGRDDLKGAVQAAVTSRNLGNNIRFEGFQPDVTPYWAAARMLVLPSQITEGAPTAVLEAQAAGLPTIAYAVGGVRELIRDGLDGYVIDVADVTRMADAIVSLLDNAEIARRMGHAARKKVREQYSIDLCARRHATAWREICGAVRD
jgi:glycosyltransferase involved in cell wall biosynthesis